MNTSPAVIQQAVFRPRSGIIIASTIVLSFIFAAYWFVVVGVGLVVWLISTLETMRNPQIQALAESLEQSYQTQELIEELDTWLGTIRNKLPDDILTRVESISQTIKTILPQIEDINSSDYNIYMIRQIAQSYLPETIGNYLKLPATLATTKKLRDDKTAHELLIGQLDLLDNEMTDLLESFHHNDTQQLLAHGRFLRDKFGESDLLDL